MRSKQTDQASEDEINKPSGFYLKLLELMVEEAYTYLVSCSIRSGQYFSFPAPESLTLEEFRGKTSRSHTEEEKKEYLTKIFGNAINIIKIEGMKFENITFPLFQDEQDDYSLLLNVIKNINFKNCTFNNQSLSSDFEEFESNTFFEGCTFNENWQLDDYPLVCYGFSSSAYVYKSCNFKKKIECIKPEIASISHPQFDELCTFDDGLEFKNVQIKANIFWTEPQRDSLSRIESLRIKNYLCQISHKFMKSLPKNNFSLRWVLFLGVMKGKFRFIDCTFSSDQEIYLANAEEASFLLERCKFEKKFKIRGLEYTGGYEYQQKHKATLKSLTFDSCQIANNDDSYLRIGFLKECEFVFKNFKNQASSELNIGDCHFKSFQLTNFRNLGKFKLFKINSLKNEGNSTVNEKFKIDNTSIGNADFQSIDLTSFPKVFMFDNIFSEISYTNVQWKNTIEVEQFEDDENIKVEKKRDTYRTLKNVALKNNDRPQALNFYVQEMDYHYQATKWSPQFGDKLILLFNKVTNGFGLFWWLPLMQLLGVSLLFYCYLWTTLNMSCVVDYGSYWKYYWVFLNPTHKTEFVASGCWNGWTYFIDLLFRVIQAFLIYQTIQAFRKFTRPL